MLWFCWQINDDDDDDDDNTAVGPYISRISERYAV